MDKEDNIIVADTYNHVLRKIDPNTMEVTTFAGKPEIYAYADGPRILARFSYPHDVSMSPYGDFYVSDTRNYLVRKISEEGEVTAVEGVNDNGQFGNMSSLYEAEEGNGVAVDSLGNIYSVDAAHNSIDRISYDDHRIFR
mmetsp:Transcript_29692/g.72326  ORF Transcript_29692/g.72326 Transcript_29692/m.72326 type:complete len:140 (-) Transcript_29692:475-894(-)